MLGPTRQYWLWVTRPAYYLDEEGNEAEYLEPGAEGWWSCDPQTRKGDLIFLWRTSPKKDIRYLLQAASNAYSIHPAAHQSWTHACDYQVLYKFSNPVRIEDIRDHPLLRSLPAYRARFQRSVFRLSTKYWEEINELLLIKNEEYRDFLKEIQSVPVSKAILLEEQLEEELAHRLDLLKKFGYHLELYKDPRTGAVGRQFVCKGIGGRIDLLCYDRRRRAFVVIELKNRPADRNTFGQISSYMGWIQKNLAKTWKFERVFGLVICRGYDAKFASALETNKNIRVLTLSELGFD